MDFYPIIVRNGFQNTPDDHTAAEKLIQWLKEHGSPSLVNFAFKNRRRLKSIIDDAWTGETADQYLDVHSGSRLQLFQSALCGLCICQGSWLQAAVQLLGRNQMDAADLCSQLVGSLSVGSVGRREDVPVVVFMGRFGGEGKSFLLPPLRAVLGVENVQATPQLGLFLPLRLALQSCTPGWVDLGCVSLAATNPTALV